MFEVYRFSQAEILTFILVLMRVSVFLVAWPVFGTNNVPTPVKILLSVLLTIILFPIVGHGKISPGDLEQFYVWLLVREAFLGVTLGYLGRLFFFAISICAQIVSDSIGLSSVHLLNPTTEERASAIEQFYTLLATLFFLGLNGHHLFLSGLVKSYEIVPVSLQALQMSALGGMGVLVQAITVTGVKLAAPVFISIFCMNVAMGIVGRAVPQINVLVTSMPVNILVGIFILVVSIPLLMTGMGELLNDAVSNIFGVLKSF